MRCQTFCRSRCSSLPGSLSFQRAAIDGDDSKLFRSRQAEQIIPAVLPKADSRIELSDPWEGGGGLSASNLSLQTPEREPGGGRRWAAASFRDVLPAALWNHVRGASDRVACKLITLRTVEASPGIEDLQQCNRPRPVNALIIE